MEFTNSFTVAAPLDRVWTFMLNAEQVAPCVPGATLTESMDETHHKGTVKVKLGAVQMNYRGELEMAPDEAARTIVLRAKGTEARGGGGASGTFTTVLAPSGQGTHVEIVTRVDVTGKVAQFGRGIMQDVANRMLKDFASCLETKIREAEGGNEPGSGEEPAVATTPATQPQSAESLSSPPSTSQATAPTETVTLAPPAPPRSTPPPEISVSRLLLEIARSRLARGLRVLADRVEPD